MVQVHLGPLHEFFGVRHCGTQEAPMKKLLILAAAAAGITWFIKQKQASAPADAWSKASDSV